MNGREFLNNLPEQPTPERDQKICDAIMAGHHPPLQWTRLKLEGGGHTGSVEVMNTGLMVGDEDPVLVSVRHVPTAEKLARYFDCVLPTAKLSDQVWLQARYKLPICTQTPDSKMATTSRMLDHHDCVSAAVAGFNATPDDLVAPVGKDWCNSRRLIGRPDRSAEYGLQNDAARYQGVTPGVHVWQPGPSLAHVAEFVDYMTGKLRFMRRRMVADGQHRDIEDVARDPALCALVSSEGTLPAMCHPAMLREGEEVGETTVDTVRPPMPLWIRTLRKGMVGDDVAAWQRVCGAGSDGVFGSKTESKTKAWQDSRGLVSDGIVGPRTRTMALKEIHGGLAIDPPEPHTYVAEPDVFDPAFMQAKNFTWANRETVHWIVLHSMEAPEKPTTAESVARWFAGKLADTPRSSAHWCYDNDSAVLCVPEEHVAWHAKRANRFGVGYELAGNARQTREEWLDDYSESMLWLSARVAANKTIPRWNVPVHFVDRDELKSAYADYIDRELPVPDELRGFTTHLEVTHGLGGSHVDPGKHFPTGRYLDMVREAQEAA
jgi:peptidoglycan hydrolase-like protein with peptidoglycan-binding domain